MQESTPTPIPAGPPRSRQRLILIGALVLTVALLLFFGTRLIRRIRNRPDRQPIRGWMSIPQVGRSYGLPPPELYRELGMEVPPPGDRRPISDLAPILGKTEAEVIAILDARVAKPPPRAPRGPPPPEDKATPTAGP